MRKIPSTIKEQKTNNIFTLYSILCIPFIVIFIPFNSIAQSSIWGINISDFDLDKDWEQIDSGVYQYLEDKNELKDFTHVLYYKEKETYHFVAQDPTGEQFYRVYEYLTSIIGREDKNADNLPSTAVGNPKIMATLVKNGEAAIAKHWINPQDNGKRFTLIWQQGDNEDSSLLSVIVLPE